MICLPPTLVPLIHIYNTGKYYDNGDRSYLSFAIPRRKFGALQVRATLKLLEVKVAVSYPKPVTQIP